ncbi:MAG: hypothetical protein AAF799_33540 [Myxococcota bacterium]
MSGSPAEALVELHDQATRFLRSQEQRLLHVVTTAPLRSGVLETLRSLEHGPHAPGPFVVLEAPHGTGDPGWDLRSEALRADYEHRCSLVEPGQPAWPSLPPPSPTRGIAGFAEQLAWVSTTVPDGARPRPWVVILNPSHVKATRQWSRGLAMLLRGSGIESTRWIVVDAERSSIDDVVTSERELREIECKPDTAAETHALQSMLAAPPVSGAPGARPEGIVAPPRPGQPPAPAPADDPVAAKRRELAKLLVDASQAQHDGQGPKAVELQRRARDLCTQAGWASQSISMELLLGGYLLGAKAGDQAELANLRAVERARTHEDDPQLLPLAELSLGSTRMALGNRPAAMLAYSEAALSAQNAGSTQLAIEACRLTGDTALLLGMDAQAIAFWSRGVTLADAEPVMAPLGSGGHCARALAIVCKQRRLHRESEQYWEAALRLEGVDVEALRERARREQAARAEAIEVAAKEAEAARAAAEQVEASPAVSVPLPKEQPLPPGPRPGEHGPPPLGDAPPSAPAAEPTGPSVGPEPTPAAPPYAPPPAPEPPPYAPNPAAEPPPPIAASNPDATPPDALPPFHTPSTGTVALGGSTPPASSRTIVIGQTTDAAQAPDEGTADLSFEEIAAMHWPGMAIGPSAAGAAGSATVVHRWSSDEEHAIRQATTMFLDGSSQSLLTREEVSAIAGEAELPPAREVSPETTQLLERAAAMAALATTDPEAEGTAWLAAEDLASIRQRFAVSQPDYQPPPDAAAPPIPAPRRVVPDLPPIELDAPGPGDETTMLTRERILELAREAAERRKNKEGKGE